MSIPLSAFQIPGGIILFLFAVSMIFGESKPEEETRLTKCHHETAVFPLAVPLIAGSSAMLATVLLTDHAQHTFVDQLQTVAIMLGVLSLTLMLAANPVNRFIGDAGASVIASNTGAALLRPSALTCYILVLILGT